MRYWPPFLLPSKASKFSVKITDLNTGASLTAVTLTVAVIAVVDSAPSLSLATAVKALSKPLASEAGVQYALLIASTLALVLAFQAVAFAELVPILSMPEVTDLTTKAVTLPSTSDSLPWAKRSARVISTAVSSFVVATAAVKDVKVGMSLTAFTVISRVSLSIPPTPSLVVMVSVALPLKFAVGV